MTYKAADHHNMMEGRTTKNSDFRFPIPSPSDQGVMGGGMLQLGKHGLFILIIGTATRTP